MICIDIQKSKRGVCVCVCVCVLQGHDMYAWIWTVYECIYRSEHFGVRGMYSTCMQVNSVRVKMIMRQDGRFFSINSGSMTAAEFMLRLQVDECHNKSVFDCGLQIKHLNLNWNYSNKWPVCVKYIYIIYIYLSINLYIYYYIWFVCFPFIVTLEFLFHTPSLRHLFFIATSIRHNAKFSVFRTN